MFYMSAWTKTLSETLKCGCIKGCLGHYVRLYPTFHSLVIAVHKRHAVNI